MTISDDRHIIISLMDGTETLNEEVEVARYNPKDAVDRDQTLDALRRVLHQRHLEQGGDLLMRQGSAMPATERRYVVLTRPRRTRVGAWDILLVGEEGQTQEELRQQARQELGTFDGYLRLLSIFELKRRFPALWEAWDKARAPAKTPAK